MRHALIQVDNQTAVLRNRQAWLDVLGLTRTKEDAVRADEQSVTKLWWHMIPNTTDARVAIMIEQATDNPLLLPEEVALLIPEEDAKVQGFYIPNPMAPLLLSTSPVNNAINVDGSANLIATFDAAPSFGTGSFHVYDSADQLVVSLSAFGQVGVGGILSLTDKVLTADLTDKLKAGTPYYVLMDDTLINGFPGIVDKTVWTWTVALATRSRKRR